MSETRFFVEFQLRRAISGPLVNERIWFDAGNLEQAYATAALYADKAGVKEFQLHSVALIGERK